MPDYTTLDKTGWFIQKMRSAWFSRPEIVDLAAKAFPTVPRKTLDGTIGQYWSDSVNPKWGTYKAIQARGLKVLENSGRRRIAERSGASAEAAPHVGESTVKTVAPPVKSSSHPTAGSARTHELWNSNNEELWLAALNRYWTFVKPSNFLLEKEMDRLDVEVVRIMDAQQWYEFLLEKYFRWKYTAPNRYASTTKMLRSYAEDNQLSVLHNIKERLFMLDKNEIQQCIKICFSKSSQSPSSLGQ